MPYNTNPTTGDGPDFASDDLAEPGVKHPYVKLEYGADGSKTEVSPAAPLPVVQTGALPAGTNNIGDVDVLSSALPTGAATSALQLPNSHDVTIDNAGGGAAVNIQDGGNSITVDGTVAISGTVDTELPAAIALGDALANPTVPGVGAYLLGWNNTASEMERVRVSNAAAGCLFVSIANVETSAALTVADGGSSLTVDGTVTAAGTVAHDSGASGNPVLTALRANTNEPGTPVTDGDATYAWGDRWGRAVTTLEHPPALAAAGTHGPYSENSTASGDVELIAAPGASTSICVTGFWISNQAAAKNRVALREGAAGTIRYRGTLAADGGGICKPAGGTWVLPANTALTINIGTAGDIDANIDFYVQATP